MPATSLADDLITCMREELDQTQGLPLALKRRTFRELQLRLHPDKNVHCAEAAKLAFQELMQQRAVYFAG